MADKDAGLHGVDDVLAYIDKTLSNVEGQGWMFASREVSEMLGDIRNGLTSSPEWSQVVESNLRAEMADTVRLKVAAAALYEAALRHVEAERDRARALAVRLEQDAAQQREEIAAEFDRRRAEALSDSRQGHPGKLQCLYESDVWAAAARVARGEQVGVRP